MCVGLIVEKCFSHDQSFGCSFMPCDGEAFVLVILGVHFQAQEGERLGRMGPEYHCWTAAGAAWLEARAQLQSRTR